MDAKQTLGEPRVFISRNALLHNVKVLRRCLQPGTKICAMVKADAYGHGASLVADTLCNFTSEEIEAPAVDMLAVATFDEADALGNVPVPLTIMRPVENIYLGRQRQRLEMAIDRGWNLLVSSTSAAGDLARVATARNRRATVQIMLDTGMSREGAPIEVVDRLIQFIESQPTLKLAGLCTHFASSEVPGNDFTQEQLSRFVTATAPHVQRNPKLLRHACNSGGVFMAPAAHFDMVRPGISLYGIDPAGTPSPERPLRPVLKWVANLHMVRNVRRGDTAGYGQLWQAERDTRLGLVPVGYADGYLRSFSNRAIMLVHGRPAKVVGRVSMDCAMIDLGDVPQANIGDEVTILDNDPLSPASAYALAKWADTIPYEMFCRIGSRVHRVAADPADQESDAWDTQDSTLAKQSA